MTFPELNIPETLSASEIETAINAINCYGVTATQIGNRKLLIKNANLNSDEFKTVFPQIEFILAQVALTSKRIPTETLLNFTHVQRSHHKDIFKTLVLVGELQSHSIGLYSLSGSFLKVMKAIDKKIEGFAMSAGASDCEFPSLVSLRDLRRTTILENYPHFLNFVSAPVRSLSTLSEVGCRSEILNLLQEPDLVCRSANCLHSYINCADSVLEKDKYLTTSGKVFRNEGDESTGIERLREFSVREIIFIGDELRLGKFISNWTTFIKTLFESTLLRGTLETSVDLFFPTKLQTLHFFQKSQQRKYEMRVDIPEIEKTISIASLNKHERYFTEAYNIKLASGDLAYSGCVGFGLERFSYALFAQHGLDVNAWPATLTDFLAADLS